MRRESVVLALLASAVFVSGLWAVEASEKLGDGNDGNRSEPVHVITLYDENGNEIDPTSENAGPVSMEKTCGECHSYDIIGDGWHFNAYSDKEGYQPPARAGEPWVLADEGTRTQIPISNRGWAGTYRPAEIELSPWQMLKIVGTHFPGGSYGAAKVNEEGENADPEHILRGPISGKFEINCLACHNGDSRQDQSDGAMQAARQNYRWVATVACGLGSVKGTASAVDEFSIPEKADEAYDAVLKEIKTTYDASRFYSDGKVFLDIAGKPDADRCYFCHSTQEVDKSGQQEWTRDEDVHMAAGLSCADCHRNGADHGIVRGDESEGAMPPASTLSCRGCHLGDRDADEVAAIKGGRLGAPRPTHPGIPVVHFRELSCTACHSGPYPKDTASVVRTSRIHKLGLHGKHAVNMSLPHVMSPVFVRGEGGESEGGGESCDGGKIGPRKMLWPAFWGVMAGDKVRPLTPEVVAMVAADALELNIQSVKRVNDWRPLSEEKIAEVLGLIAEDQGAEAVYVAGGRLYRLDGDELVSEEHAAAKPYSWPIAHDVRPASQSLGSEGNCDDCHSMNSPFFFGKVAVDSPVTPPEIFAAAQSTDTDTGGDYTSATELEYVEMVQFEDVNATYIKMFNFSFVFRPIMKLTVLISSVLIVLTLLCVPRVVCPVASQGPILLVLLRQLAMLGVLACIAVLALTGFVPRLLTGNALGGLLLMLHATCAPVFIACIAFVVLSRAYQCGMSSSEPAAAPVTTVGLCGRVFSWVAVILAIVLSVSIVFSMYPIFGTHGQEVLFNLHRCSAIAFLIVGVMAYVCAKKA